MGNEGLRRSWSHMCVSGILGLVGCQEEQKVCTGIGCANQLTVEVTTANWAPGAYRVDLEYDERSFVCNFDVAALGEGGGGGGQPDDEVSCVQTAGKQADDWDSPNGFRSESLWLYVPGPPLEVDVTIELDDKTLVDTTLKPKYTESYPNGRDCDPRPCLSGSETLDL